MDKDSVLKLLASPIAYYAILAKISGGVTAGVFLSQLIYWTGRGKQADGWIWKSADEMESETGLTRTEQETARRKLKDLGFIEERLAGVPATLHFRVNLDAIMDAVNMFGANSQSSFDKSAKLDSTKAPNLIRQKRQTNPENTQSELAPQNTQSELAPQKIDDTQPDNAQASATTKAVQAEASVSEKKETARDIPAAVVYHELTHRWPPRATWPMLRQIANGGVERWREIVTAYIAQGWNPGNISGMVEFYQRGEIPGQARRIAAQARNGKPQRMGIADAFALAMQSMTDTEVKA